MAIRFVSIKSMQYKDVERIKSALHKANIEHYETKTTGIGSYSPNADAIWLKNNSDYKQACNILSMLKINTKNKYSLINKSFEFSIGIIAIVILTLLLAWCKN